MQRKLRNYYKFITVGSAFALLTGCTGMASDYNCPNGMGEGAKCRSLSAVNKMVKQGEIKPNDKADSASVTPIEGQVNYKNGYNIETPTAGEPIRYGDQIQRVWIAPFRDKDDNYYEGSYAYVVVKKSHWIGQPLEAIQSDDEE